MDLSINATSDPIQKMLAERGGNYGDFTTQGELAQLLKDDVRRHLGGHNWYFLNCNQREALDMILHKISRIVNGNPNFVDSWQDIIGYAQLVIDRIKTQPTAQEGTQGSESR